MPTLEAKDTRLSREEAFLQSEASVRLEGIDPMDHPHYVAIRNRVISGELTTEQAGDLLLARYTHSHDAAA